MATRLHSRAADLSHLIESAATDAQRRIAVKVAETVMTAIPIDEREIDHASADLAAARWGGPGMHCATALADRFDDLAMDIQRQATGAADSAKYLDAFRRARALSAVAFALDSDARIAALEAAYEAEAALEDLRPIRAIVTEVLGIEPGPAGSVA